MRILLGDSFEHEKKNRGKSTEKNICDFFMYLTISITDSLQIGILYKAMTKICFLCKFLVYRVGKSLKWLYLHSIKKN